MDVWMPQFAQVDVKVDGVHICVIKDGQVVLALPWDGAQMLAKALRRSALQVEEYCKANKIAFESAVLVRKGWKFSLTNHPDIAAEAEKEAAWNRDLRRYIPGGVKSRARVGTPTVIRHPPPPRRSSYVRIRRNDNGRPKG